MKRKRSRYKRAPKGSKLPPRGAKGRKAAPRVPLLEQAKRVLVKQYPVVVRDGGVLWIGGDAFVCDIPDEPGILGLRFWKGAAKRFRAKTEKVLKTAKLPYKVGPVFELENKKTKQKADPSLTDVLERATDDVKAIVKNPHVATCLMCKQLLENAEGETDTDYQQRAVDAVARHIDQKPAATGPKCMYPDCIHHEKVEKAFAEAIIRVGHGDKPWRDVRGILVSNVSLVVREKDHPPGWDFTKQDVMDRHFTELPPSAGNIYIKLSPKGPCDVHLWIEPQFKSRREDVEDVPTVDDILATYKERVPAIKEWVLKKYKDLIELVRMDVALEE